MLNNKMLITKENFKKINNNGHKAIAVPCKNGLFTLEVIKEGKERLIHSKYDPVGEARKAVGIAREIKNSATIFVFGLGMGYHIYEILNIAPREAEISVYEPCAEVIKLFVEKNGTALLDDRRINLYLLGGKKEIKIDALSVKNCDSFTFFPHPAYTQIFGEEQDALVGAINREATALLTQKNTIRAYGTSWSVNFLANYKHISESAAVKGLFGLLKGGEAIVVAAGPSLSKNVAELERARGRAIIICCDTAYREMEAHNISPDIIVTTSGSPSAVKKLEGAVYDYPLVYKSQSAKEILSAHKSEKFYSSYINDFLDGLLGKVGIETGVIDSGGSVACSCIDLAVKMGVNSVIMTGQDLALTGGKAYAEHTTVPFTETINEGYITETIDIYGKTVKTLQNLNAYRRWIERYIEKYPLVRFIDATEGGALINGTEIMPLREVLKTLSSEGIDIKGIIKEAFEKNSMRKSASIAAQGYRDAFVRFQEAKKLVKEIIAEYEAGVITQGRIAEAACKLLEYTEAVKYSVIADVFDIQNINAGEIPEITYFKKIAQTLDGLTEPFESATEV